MLWKSWKKRRRGDDTDAAPVKPTALTLIGRIVMSLFDDGIQWLSITALAVLFYLQYNHIENDALTALVIVGLIVIALLRGCRAWQQDLQEYQRHLALMHHRNGHGKNNAIPGYFPSRRY